MKYDNLVSQKRKEIGLTQKQFAEMLGLGASGERTISGWERGEHKPSAAKLRSLMNIVTDTPFKNIRSKNDFDFIDLFAGVGGIRLPFQKLGGRCVFTSEWDKFSKKTYAANFGEYPDGDITKIKSDEIPPHDLLLAGFPCQAFSIIGQRKGINDKINKKGEIIFHLIEFLIAKSVKFFIFENVKGLINHDRGQTLKIILDELDKAGYLVKWKLLNILDYGVAQIHELIYFHKTHACQ